MRIELVDARRGAAQAARAHGSRRGRARCAPAPARTCCMNVTSARIDIKAAAARAERWLERYAEPFSALHGRGWPGEFLALAWRRVIENSAHDSICGCSADAVSAQVLVRFAEAEQIGARPRARGARAGTRGDASRRSRRREPVAVRARRRRRARPSRAGRSGATSRSSSRTARTSPRRSSTATRRCSPAPRCSGARSRSSSHRRLHGRELFRPVAERLRARARPAVSSSISTPSRIRSTSTSIELRTAIEVAANAQPDDEWEVVMRTRPRRRLRRPRRRAGARLDRRARAVEGRVARATRSRPERTRLENGLLRVEVADDGTLRVGDLDGVGRIVRGLDVGDSYNYAPPADDVLVDQPESVRVEIREERADPCARRRHGARTRGRPTTSSRSETLVELRADEPFVRMRVAVRQPGRRPARARARAAAARGRRTRSPRASTRSSSAALDAEGGYGEVPLPTFPASSFVGGGRRRAPARARVGVRGARRPRARAHRPALDRADQPQRRTPTARILPALRLPIPDAQMRGRHSFGVRPLPVRGRAGRGPTCSSRRSATGCRFSRSRERAPRASSRSAEGLTLEGEGVALTALRRVGEGLEARVVNETPEPRTMPRGGEQLELGPWEIRTAMPTTG